MHSAMYKDCPNCGKENHAYEADVAEMEGGDYDIKAWTSNFHCECGERYNDIQATRVEKDGVCADTTTITLPSR